MSILHSAHSVLTAICFCLCCEASAEEVKPELHGAGWMQAGFVEHSTPVLTKASGDPYSKDWMQNSGVQAGTLLRFSENWEAGIGLGAVQIHVIGGREDDGAWYPFIVPFVSEARLSYSDSLPRAGKFLVTLGYFPFDYNPDIKDLGLYLMHGYVYPGTLASGFGNVFGGLGEYQYGGFKNDLILNSEIEDRPFFDYSLADIIDYRISAGFDLGVGINFYRLMQSQGASTCAPNNFVGSSCAIVDTVSGDTLTGSLAATKLMGRFHLDPKRLFGFSQAGPLSFGKSDLILYGEAAILGLKDYPVYYPRLSQRIPVMLGFNLPAFNLLDNLSLEVEYYASKHSSDDYFAHFGSWVPADPNLIQPVNFSRDDWKWALYADKVFAGRIKLSLLFANDHLRFGGTHDHPNGVEAMNTLADWYWTSKVGYFF